MRGCVDHALRGDLAAPGGDLAALWGVHSAALGGDLAALGGDLAALGGVSNPHESVGELSWATLSWGLGRRGAARMEQ